MTVKVELTAETFRRFTVFDTLKRRKMWKNPAIFALILCVSGILCLVLPTTVRGSGFLSGVLITIGLGIPLAYFLSFYLSVRQQIRQLGLTRPQWVYTLDFSETDNLIHIHNEKESVDYPWKKVHHVYRDLTATYLYITARQAFILPHSCVENIEALCALIQQKLPQEKNTAIG